MPSLTIQSAALEARGAGSRANRHPAQSLPLPVNINHAIQRLHVRTAGFPISFLATDDTIWSRVRSKSAYYSVIARAVSRLPNNTLDARLAVYDRAEIALTAELLRHPQISDAQVAVERLAFEKAILKIEGDARRQQKAGQKQKKQQRHLRSLLSLFRMFSPRFHPLGRTARK
jgi:hypothetical protein